MDLGLQGRRALVTGGTKGIGRAIVDTLAAEGAAVGFCARSEADVAATVAALTEGGTHAVGRVADVSDEAALQRWVTESARGTRRRGHRGGQRERAGHPR